MDQLKRLLKEEVLKAKWFTVAPGVWGMKDLLVNIYMIHDPLEKKWVLVDAGLKWSAPRIKNMALHLFWPDVRPAAIILTHGHFDHTGSLASLAADWEVPVYAHSLEMPYLTGKSSYPPPDPTVGGGLMSTLAWVYPNAPIDVSKHVQELPDDGTIPHLPGWKYLHTPGHTPGHISLFRESDRVLIAGDAFVTTQQESIIAALTQIKKMSGPPKYFTYDWEASANSVAKLASLEPEVAATGHGQPMEGEELREALHRLSREFFHLAVPSNGRYVKEPAVADKEGVRYLPPRPKSTLIVQAALVAGLAAGLTWFLARRVKRATEGSTAQLLGQLAILSRN